VGGQNVDGVNRLLAALSPSDLRRFESDLEKVSLAMKEVIYEPNEIIEYVYFPTSGMISLLITMDDGRAVEIGTIGNEGMAGTPVFLGSERSPTKAISQAPGNALRMPVAAFKRLVEELPAVELLIRRYAQAMINQIAQSAACNHLHSIEERMCRWLLMSHDRVGADEFPLSQEFLSQMLGVRRPSVTIAAGILQQAGLISYRRGHMTIQDREGLEAGACECYRIVKKEFDRLLGALD
jgi:CRP-like cAMP-binding protein